MYLSFFPRVKDQGETKDEPMMNLRTPNHQKSTFVKIAVSFTSLIPSLKTPTNDREMTERTPTELPVTQKCFLLILTTSSLLCPLLPHLMRHLVLLCLLPPPKKNHIGVFLSSNSPKGDLTVADNPTSNSAAV